MRAVEIDAVVVLEVRVFILAHAAGGEPDLTFVVVHLDHVAHHPFASSDLVFHATGTTVIQVEMIPAIAFRHPDDLATHPADIVGKAAPGIDEGPGAIHCHHAHGPSFGI